MNSSEQMLNNKVIIKATAIGLLVCLTVLPHLNTPSVEDGFYRLKSLFISLSFFYWLCLAVYEYLHGIRYVYRKTPFIYGVSAYLFMSVFVSLFRITDNGTFSRILLEANIILTSLYIYYHYNPVYLVYIVRAALISSILILSSHIIPVSVLNKFPLLYGLSISGNQNMQAQYYIILLPVLWAAFFTEKQRYIRWLSLILFAFIFYELMKSRTIGAYLAVLISFVFMSYKSRKRFLSFVIITIIAGALWVNKTDFSSGSSGASFRLNVWNSTLNMSEEKTLTGFGPERFYKYFPFYRNPSELKLYGDVPLRIPSVRTPHNDYLMILSERGIITLGVFVYFLILWLVDSGKTKNSPIETAIGAACLATLVHAFFSSNLSQLAPLYFFFIGTALTAAEDENKQCEIIQKTADKSTRGWQWVVITIIFISTAVIQLRRISSAVLNYQASVFASNGKHDIAQNYYERSMKFHPSSFSAHFYRAQIFRMYKRYTDAEKEYLTAKTLWQGYKDIYFNLSQIYFAKGELGLSMINIKKFLSLNPYDARGMVLKGDIYRGSNKFKEAKRWYRLAAGKNYFEPAMKKLDELEEQESIKNKTEQIAAAKEIKEKGNMFFKLAGEYAKQGDKKKSQEYYLMAKNSYTESLKLYPFYTDALNNLASVEMQMQNPEEAVALYEKVISIDPGYVSAYRNIAVVYHKYGDFLNSVYYFKKYLESDSVPEEERISIEKELKRIKGQKL